jgi:quinol monooxygenase YgiN
MIIVSGHIVTKPGARDAFIERSREAILAARKTDGCRDFVVAADPIDPNRVCIYEVWDDTAKLLAFRGSGPGDDLSTLIESADVKRHEVASTGPA